MNITDGIKLLKATRLKPSGKAEAALVHWLLGNAGPLLVGFEEAKFIISRIRDDDYKQNMRAHRWIESYYGGTSGLEQKPQDRRLSIEELKLLEWLLDEFLKDTGGRFPAHTLAMIRASMPASEMFPKP